MAWNYWINLIKEEVLHIRIREEEKADIDMEPCFDTAFSAQEIPVYSFLYWAGVLPVFFRNTWVKWLWSQKCRSAAICCNSMVPETRSCLDVSI